MFGFGTFRPVDGKCLGRTERLKIISSATLGIARRDPFEVEDRDQHFEALRSARVGRKDCRGKANALGAFTDTVAHPRPAHGDRTNTGHDLALLQMSMAHQSLAALVAR